MVENKAKPKAAKKAASKKTASTKAAEVPTTLLGFSLSRSPAPLPEPASGDATVDEIARAIMAGGPDSVPAHQRLASEAKRLPGASLAALLVREGLELGALHLDDADKLPPKERRAYKAAYNKAETASRDRAWWFRWVGHAAAQHEEGAARLRELIADVAVPWEVRELLARMLFDVRPDERATLDALATLLSVEGDPNALAQVHRLGARAILKREKSAAFDELSPLLGEPRASSVMLAVFDESPRVDERWLERVLPLLDSGKLNIQLQVLSILLKLPVHPRMQDAVLRFFGDPAKMTFVFDDAIRLLGICGDAQSTPVLLRALHMNTGRKDVILEALRRCGDPAAAPALRAHEKSLRARPEAAQLAGEIELVDAVATQLERRGPAPVPAVVPTAAKLPRQRRQLAPSKPASPPPESSLAAQRKDLLEAFAEAGIAKDVATALIRPGIQLFSTRTEDAVIPVGATKLGGCPDLPKGMEWPRLGHQIFSFVAQLRMEDLTPLDVDGLLPKKGLLSFFVQDEFGEPLDYLGAVKVMLLDGPLERATVPEGFDLRPHEHVFREPFAACTLRAWQMLGVPPHAHPLATRLVPEDKSDAYTDSVFTYSSGANQLLGFREHDNGEQTDDMELLFLCKSDDEAGMEWGDVQDLAFMLPRAALLAGDFTKVVAVVCE